MVSRPTDQNSTEEASLWYRNCSLEILLTLVPSMFVYVAASRAQEAAFTKLHDLVPDRCFSAALSTVDATTVAIGMESGYNPVTWKNKACTASTAAFNTGSVTDTFSATVTAPPGMHISRISYEQVGSRLLERSTYWFGNGTGTLTVNGVPLSFSFTNPTLIQTVDLAGQNLESTTVSVTISLRVGRNSAFPRVGNPPGSASMRVTDAVIRAEYRDIGN